MLSYSVPSSQAAGLVWDQMGPSSGIVVRLFNGCRVGRAIFLLNVINKHSRTVGGNTELDKRNRLIGRP